MTAYKVTCQGDPADIIQLCKTVLVSKSAKIKSIDLDQAIIVSTFRYGINPNGLKMVIHVNHLDQDNYQISISAEFTNAVDVYGIADRKAAEIQQLIQHQLEQPSSHNTELHQHDFQQALNQVKSTSIVSWTIIVLIGLSISAIPTGFGFILIPLIGLIGAVIGLAFSRWLAKRAHQVVVIERHNESHHDYFWLYDTVARLAAKANIPTPEVGVYQSEDMNAFASGATPQLSVVAFSTGLLEQMNDAEIEAVAAHEIGHIISNDMRGMAILTGLISSFVLVFTLPLQGLRILNLLGNSFSTIVEIILWLTKLVLSIVLTFFGSLLVKKYSRNREYKADAIASLLVGKDPMISALSRLSQEKIAIPIEQRGFNAFKISNQCQWAEIFNTHPSIEKRIQALQTGIHSPV